MKTNKQILEEFRKKMKNDFYECTLDGEEILSEKNIEDWLEQSLKDVEERVKGEMVENIEKQKQIHINLGEQLVGKLVDGKLHKSENHHKEYVRLLDMLINSIK